MKRTVWADEQVTALVNASFIPVTIDVDDPGSTATSRSFSFMSRFVKSGERTSKPARSA